MQLSWYITRFLCYTQQERACVHYHLLAVLALHPERHAVDIPLVSFRVCRFGVPPVAKYPLNCIIKNAVAQPL